MIAWLRRLLAGRAETERARLEAIVIAQQKRLKYYEVRHDTMHRELLDRGAVNARLNKELQKLQRQAKHGQGPDPGPSVQ